MSSLNNLTGSVRDGFQGFDDLANELGKYIEKSEKYLDLLVIGAKAFVSDLDKLSKPMSKIKRASYTHLIDAFSYEVKKDEVITGWGKYYGRMVEKGTEKMNPIPHFYPVWEKNKDKYYQLMLNQFKL